MESILAIVASLGASCARCSVPADLRSACGCVPVQFSQLQVCLPGLQSVYSAGEYQGDWRHAILRAKEQPRSAVVNALFRDLATSNLSSLLAQKLSNHFHGDRVHVCAPPPSLRRRIRAWHFAGECARWGARQGIWRTRQWVRRVRATAPQAAQSGVERRQNLRGASKARPDRGFSRLPSSVWLIDDVMTTGSTLSECARALRAAGVQEVNALLLSHVSHASLASVA